ncbi:MAG: hypothetical protein ACTSP3_13585 [Candidatus Heimdallarchaeaceae archaeon]
MKKELMLQIVKDLDFDTKCVVYEEENLQIYLWRPSKLSKRFKDYDLKTNFQIWMREKKREFRPNHLRVMIDLNLRVRSRPRLKEKLLLAFDEIYYGADPEIALADLSNEIFSHSLNPIIVIGFLSQLFIIEQEYGYPRESKFDPPTLFYQGWIREFIDNPKEIDILCMSVCNRQPPMAKYTSKENKKHKKYVEKREPLWYLT